MAATQSSLLASILVARFLRSNNFTETLDTFIREAGLPPHVGQTSGKEDSSSSWTIEGVLEEKKAFDKSVNFERYGEDEKDKGVWSIPAPSKPTILETPTSSNLLAASVELWQHPTGDEADLNPDSYIVATGADKQMHLFKTTEGNDKVTSFEGHSDSPILSYASFQNGRYHVMTNMSGQLLLQMGTISLDSRKDHSKYAVKVTAVEDDASGNVWVATAGWDAKIFIYKLNLPRVIGEDPAATIGEPVAYINLTTNPECISFVRNEDSGELILLASQRDSTYLYYYGLEPSSSSTTTTTTTPYESELLGKQNLAPHSNAWVAFSPSSFAVSPHDPGLLAVALSTLPHMKVMIVRLLFPAKESLDAETAAEPETQASQALAALSLQNREDTAIVIQANTFATQTAYSTPQVVWRPDGSGVWVNGDDGVIRGIEAKTGNVVVMLKDGHDYGCKVRTIWSGWVDVPRDGEVVKEEWVVSGGFDKKLIVWRR